MCMYIPAGIKSLIALYRSEVLLVLALSLGCFTLCSQRVGSVRWYSDGTEAPGAHAKLKDSAQLASSTEDMLAQFREEGHLFAMLDSIAVGENETSVHLHRAKRYIIRYFEIATPGNVALDPALATRGISSFPSEHYRSLVNALANRGRPFAHIEIFAVIRRADTIYFGHVLHPGPLVRFLQPEQGSESVLRDFALQRLSGIRAGSPFSQRRIDQASPAFRTLPYLSIEAAPSVFFPGSDCLVRFYLNHQAASRFELLLGLNSNQGNSERGLSLTGTGNLDLVNLFRMGERMRLDYENLSDNSPHFALQLEFPNLPYIPIGLATEFSLYRFRESYQDIQNSWRFSYAWDARKAISLIAVNNRSDLLQADTARFIASGRLPTVLDYRYLAVGIRYRYADVDNALFPRSGLEFTFEGDYGKKSYPENPIFFELAPNPDRIRQQYDSLRSADRQARLSVQLGYHHKIAGKHGVYAALQARSLLSDGGVLENEWYRIGGAALLRGFDEEIFRVSRYAVFSLEYRFFLDRISFISAFNDLGLFPNMQSDLWRVYDGLGVGIHFQTKAGLFGLQYAVASGAGQKFQWTRGKVHFGFSALF